METSEPTVHAGPVASRLLFLDFLRAFASLMILWHHFALYPPLSTGAHPILGPVLDWLRDYSRATQVFFVIGGYVMARSLSTRNWDVGSVGRFVVKRYCRLGLPYLAAAVLAIAACAYGRGWLPEPVVGSPPTLPQVLAHVFFVQEFFGYEHFSAGLWFVCINFQLGLIYVATLFLRDSLARCLPVPRDSPWINLPILIGWALSVASLFYFNRDPVWDHWAWYFFPFFFTGILVHRAEHHKRGAWMFYLYLLLVMAAMGYDWRWRLASMLVVGLVLHVAGKSGLNTRWPKSPVIARLGRTSYSLFLIHFPVLVLVAAVWARLGWSSPIASVMGLLVAFAGSLAGSLVFYRWVEAPAGNLTRRSSRVVIKEPAPR